MANDNQSVENRVGEYIALMMIFMLWSYFVLNAYIEMGIGIIVVSFVLVFVFAFAFLLLLLIDSSISRQKIIVYLILFFSLISAACVYVEPQRESYLRVQKVISDIKTIEESIAGVYSEQNSKRIYFSEIKSGSTSNNIKKIFLSTVTAEKIEERIKTERHCKFNEIRDPWGNPYVLTFEQGTGRRNKNNLTEIKKYSKLKISLCNESLEKYKNERSLERFTADEVRTERVMSFDPMYTEKQQ